MAETSVPDAEAFTFFGLAAPAGTPASIISRINATMNEGLQTPEIQALITNVGTESKPGTPEEFGAVRPDGHVAWRGSEMPADAGEVIDRLRGAPVVSSR